MHLRHEPCGVLPALWPAASLAPTSRSWRLPHRAAGPDGLIGVIPGESNHSAKLLELCQRCHDNAEVLVCSVPAADIVLVPRQPSTAAKDGLYFLAFATNLSAVELCEELRAEQKVRRWWRAGSGGLGAWCWPWWRCYNCYRRCRRQGCLATKVLLQLLAL